MSAADPTSYCVPWTAVRASAPMIPTRIWEDKQHITIMSGPKHTRSDILTAFPGLFKTNSLCHKLHVIFSWN